MNKTTTQFLSALLLASTVGVHGVAIAKHGADDTAPDDRSGSQSSSSSTDDNPKPSESSTSTDDKGGQRTTASTDDNPKPSDSSTSTDDKGGLRTTASTDDNPKPSYSSASTDDKGGNTNGSGSQASAKVRLKLKINDDSVSPVSSQFTYEATQKGANFDGSLKIKLPDSATGLSRNTAKNALMTATLSRANQPYAVCELGFDRFAAGAKAQYTLDLKTLIRKGKPVLRQHKGGCDVNMAESGIQAGIPATQSGDDLLLEYHIEPAPATGPDTVMLGQGKF